jgi:hypothetical protein
MNVLDNYKKELLNLGDPYEIDDDLYYCKFNYNNMPFMIKTNKICVFKSIKKNKDNYVNISITSKDYLMWFESFYNWCIETFCERSEDWFKDPLTLSDVEFSFINPLKSNIKDNCFDIQCITDSNRLHIVDTNDNVNSLESLKDCNIIPTFHIKGVKFNTTYFSLDIEVNNMLVILEDLDESNDDINIPDTSRNNLQENVPHIPHIPDVPKVQFKQSDGHSEDKSNKYLEKDNEPDELNEVNLPTNDLEEMTMDIESNGFYEIYQLIDEKIKDNIIQNLQKLFNKKKIKLNMELTDIFDEEE